MADCMDCLHFDICQLNEKEQAIINLKSSYRDISNDIADGCRFFKNKADFVEVKHSKWFGVADYGNGNCIAYCYKCGTTIKAQNPTALKMFHKHCHWCGAKMDLEEGADNG